MMYTFQTVEEQITRHLINTLLEAFPSSHITVEDDDGEVLCEPTRDANDLFDACRSVDMAFLFVDTMWVSLVNGNGEDVISDYVVGLEKALAPLNAAIDKKFG